MGAIGADGVTMDAIGRHVLVALVTTTAENEKSVLIGTTAPMLDGGEVCCPYVASVAEMFYKVSTQAHPKKKTPNHSLSRHIPVILNYTSLCADISYNQTPCIAGG